MSSGQNKKIEILDCTIRDGGYINNWHFDKKLVRETYRALSKSGVDYVELGFRGNTKLLESEKNGIWRFSNEADLREATSGIEGSKISIMGDYGKIELDDFENRRDSVVEMVRIAAHKNNIYKAIDLLDKVKAKGYKVSLQAMGYSGYTKKEIAELRNVVKGSGLDYIYVADSYGSMFPDEMEKFLEPFIGLKAVKSGFHAHNNLQMAFANTLEAIRVGVDIVDCSVYGMGRGAGNLPTEILIAYLAVHGDDRYNVVTIMNCIHRYFMHLKEVFSWGYQLPYMTSGIFKCHPFYAAELINSNECVIEDLWRGLEVIKEIDPIGFDPGIIEQMVKRGVLGDLCKKNQGRKKEVITESGNNASPGVPYVNRHSGRDFLILANGPSLLQSKQQIELFIEKYTPIILGANYLGGLFIPHYHAFNNENRFVMYVDSVHPESKLLVGENIPKKSISEYVKHDYETLFFKDVLESDFAIQNGRIQTNCRTISVLLLAVAVVMNAKRIFVAGMDGYIDKKGLKETLFYDEQLEPNEDEMIMSRHYWNERFIGQIDHYVREKNGEGIHIITPTSHHSFYKGINNYL